MVKTLTVKCPHCSQISQIYLSTNACVIILNCPSCYSPIMYFDRKIFLLTRNQVEAIRRSSKDSAVLKMLQRIAHSEKSVTAVPKKITSTSYDAQTKLSRSCAVKSAASALRERSISEDDITNLRITLELCRDSQEFIEQM